MCQFNLLIIDKESQDENLEELFIEHGFGFRELNNRSLQNQIGDFKKIILTTKGHCDCGSILGRNHQNPIPKVDIEKERKKLRKKNWSESKIERYLSDKLQQQNRKDETRTLGNEIEENNWIRLSKTFRNQKRQFGILFHHFTGPIEEEEIVLEKTNLISIELLSEGELRNLEEDELNWITK